jgi:hypothetical protein
MTHSGCIGLCAGLALSLFALGCGSSNSGSGTSNPGPWDQARIGNSGTSWWINASKDKYFLSIKVKPSYAEDVQGRAQVVSIAKTVAAKAGSLPKPEEISGKWINDPDQSATADGPVVATDETKAVDLIDGGAAPFFTSSYKAKSFTWANFIEDDASKDTPYKIELIQWEMASASDAKTLYGDLLKNSLYSNVTWKTCAGTDANDLCP